VITDYPITTAASKPTGIALGPDGAFWFTENAGNKIGRITTSGLITNEYPIPTANSGPQAIAVGPDSALWFTESTGNKIGRISTSGVITEYPIPTANSSPQGIVTGPDGLVWFTESRANQIGSITTSGTITEYGVLTSNSQPTGITTDGWVLWFTETAGNNVGMITPQTALSPPPLCDSCPPKSGPVQAGWVTEFPIGTANSAPLGISIPNPMNSFTGFANVFPVFAESAASANNIAELNYNYLQYPLFPGVCVPGPGEVGVIYTESPQPCPATNGGNPTGIGYIYSATGLPPGLSIDSVTGAITGTPTTSGSYPVVLGLGDSQNGVAYLPTTIVIYPPLTLTCTPAPAPGEVGVPYSSSPCTAAGGDPPYHYSATGLPTGLSINATTGAITGTPTTAGTYNSVTIAVSASFTPAQSVSQTITIVIYPPLTLTCNPPVPGVVGLSYSASPCAAGGGDPPYRYSATGLPPGLSINTATGAITGTPTTAGTYNSVTITVSDSFTPAQSVSQPISITIILKLTLNCGSGTQGPVGNPYIYACTALGGLTPYTWSATGLPSGLSINASTGQITGTPTASGSYLVTVTVTDSTTPIHQTASSQFPIALGSKVTLSCSSPNPGTIGTSYSATPCSGSGGTPPYLWTASGLPPGLSINANNGTISGTPMALGSYPVTVSIDDSGAPNFQGAAQQITIVINPVTLTLSCTSPAAGTVQVAFSASPCTQGGGASPFAWSWSAQTQTQPLPPGLSINTTTGAITGTPTSAGSYPVTVTVKDSSPTPQTQSSQFTILISPSTSTFTLSCTSPAAGTVQVAFSASPCTQGGGTSPFAWSWSAQTQTQPLPPGLSINATTGAVTGTPTTAGSYPVTVTVKDSSPTPQTQSSPFTITINPVKLNISCGTALQGVVGTAYSAMVCSATGGTPQYKWAVGGLPPGLSSDPGTGAITGTPTTAGPYPVTVTVTDSSPTSQTQSSQFTITILPGTTISSLTVIPTGTTKPPQSDVTITLNNPSADTLNGVLCMTFQVDPSVLLPPLPPSSMDPYLDASIRNADSSLLMQCPAGSISAASFTLGPSDGVTKSLATIIQGTVAGQIGIVIGSLLDGNTSVLPSPNNSVPLVIPPAIPQITVQPVVSSVVNGAFTVSLSGYTNTRQLTEADFTFTPSSTSGATLNNSGAPVTIAVPFNGADQTQYFQTAAAAGAGGSFALKVTLSYSGDPNALGTVSVLLKNKLAN
jgi:hypothetical protein